MTAERYAALSLRAVRRCKPAKRQVALRLKRSVASLARSRHAQINGPTSLHFRNLRLELHRSSWRGGALAGATRRRALGLH